MSFAVVHFVGYNDGEKYFFCNDFFSIVCVCVCVCVCAGLACLPNWTDAAVCFKLHCLVCVCVRMRAFSTCCGGGARVWEWEAAVPLITPPTHIHTHTHTLTFHHPLYVFNTVSRCTPHSLILFSHSMFLGLKSNSSNNFFTDSLCVQRQSRQPFPNC